MKKSFSLAFVLAGILFNVCLILSNILEVKLIQIGPVLATGGLLVFPLSYILNDCIAEVWGYKKARLIIWSGFAMNFTVVLFIQAVAILPPAPGWEKQEAFVSIFEYTPRIAFASFLAFLTGSFLNAYVMSRMKVASKGKHFSFRAIASTIVGETADSLIFFPLAFGGVIPLEQMVVFMFTQAGLKTVYEILILPVTVQVVKYIKKTEGAEAFDKGISYHILKIRDV